MKTEKISKDIRENIKNLGSSRFSMGRHETHLIDNEGIFVSDVTNNFFSDILLIGAEEPEFYRNRHGTFHPDKTFPKIPGKVTAATFTSLIKNNLQELILITKQGKLYILIFEDQSFSIERQLRFSSLENVTGVATGDVNQDGCPDLFIIQYGKRNDAPHRRKQFNLGAKYLNLQGDNGLPNALLLGNCANLEFEIIDKSTFNQPHWSLAASFFDATGNNRQDIHVANDFFRDSLYLQDTNGNFSHRYLPITTDRNGMSSTVVNFNNNTVPDLFVSNVYLDTNNKVIDRNRFSSFFTAVPEGHNALINNGDGEFEDYADELNLKGPGWGWAVSWNDFTNNSQRELLQVTENFLSLPTSMKIFRLDDEKILSFAKRYYPDKKISVTSKKRKLFNHFRDWIGYPNLFHKNGKSFKPLDERETNLSRINGRGVVSLDYNLDGKLDFLVSNFGGPFRLIENRTSSNSWMKTDNNWIKLKIKKNFQGGLLNVTINKNKKIRVPVTSRNDFMSQESRIFHQGLGSSKTVKNVRVEWNTGDNTDHD